MKVSCIGRMSSSTASWLEHGATTVEYHLYDRDASMRFCYGADVRLMLLTLLQYICLA